MLKILTIFPLLAIPAIIFILITVISGGDGWISQPAIQVSMPTNRLLVLAHGDLFVITSLIVLFIEVVKSVRTEAIEIINHGLSVLVLVICLLLFITNASFENAPFLLLVLMSLFDVVAGITITTVSARRDFGGGTAGH